MSKSGARDWMEFAPLLTALTLAMLAVGPLADAGYGGLAASIAFPALVAAATFGVRRAGRSAWLAVGLWAGFNGLAATLGGGTTSAVIARLADACFVAFVGVVPLREVIQSRRVSVDTILGGISVYLLIAIFFSFLYSALEAGLPGSFLDGGATLRAAEGYLPGTFPALSYYSLVTMTTLGYGDVAPTGALPRSLAAAQAVVGQLYVAILIASLVGVYISQGQREE